MEYILVTGGLGYIGSHVVVELLRQGHNVVILDNCSNSDMAILDVIKSITDCPDYGRLIFHRADIRKGSELAAIFTAYKVSSVIHLAGSSGSEGPPLNYFSNNVSGTITLLSAMKHFGCRRIIYGSSASIYGNVLNPVCEQDRVGRGQLSPFARSVLMVEQILQEQIAADPDWSISVLRLFDVCGSFAQLPKNINSVLYKLQSTQQIVIYGSEHATPDGTYVRDYIHVADAATAFISSMRVAKGFHIYNIGSGSGISILELLNLFSKINNINISVRFEEPRRYDVPILYACIGKAFNELGWRPQKTINNICAFV
jgi:UDP-glucose 4-epimerase